MKKIEQQEVESNCNVKTGSRMTENIRRRDITTNRIPEGEGCPVCKKLQNEACRTTDPQGTLHGQVPSKRSPSWSFNTICSILDYKCKRRLVQGTTIRAFALEGDYFPQSPRALEANVPKRSPYRGPITGSLAYLSIRTRRPPELWEFPSSYFLE